MSSRIYSEAIAEAKQLRDAAEQNAKNAIVEAVTPKIREFIDAQLLAENGAEDSEDSGDVDSLIAESLGFAENSEEDYVNLDSGALSTLASLIGADADNQSVLQALSESINGMGSENAKYINSAAKKLADSADSFMDSKINNDMSDKQESSKMGLNEVVYDVDLDLLKEEMKRPDEGYHKMEGGHEPADEGAHAESPMFDEGSYDSTMEEEEERELKEMLASLGLLSEDKIEVDLGDHELPEDVMPVASVVREDDEDEEAGDELMDMAPAEEEEEGEAELEALDEVLEIDPKILRQELLRIRNLVSEAKSLADEKGGADSMEAHFGGQGGAGAGAANQFGGKAGKGGNPFGGGSEKGDVYKVKLNALAESLRKEQRKNRSLERRLDEYRGAVETLREQLTDLNLFNAKLLYVNKLFQDRSVPPAKRRTVMESIDSAKSLREVKLIYKTLTGDSSSKDKKPLNESTARTLGSSSRSVGRSSARSSDVQADRWAALAGIK